VQEINALGQTTESLLGNGLTRVFTYDSYHQLDQLHLKNGTSYLDVVDYGFDPLTGNLLQRQDYWNSRNEFFFFSNLLSFKI
jgi:hypothetical protein